MQSKLTGNGDTALRGYIIPPLKLEGDVSRGRWLPAQRSCRARSEAIATVGVVERVGTLGRSKSRKSSEDDIEEGTHVAAAESGTTRLKTVRVEGSSSIQKISCCREG